MDIIHRYKPSRPNSRDDQSRNINPRFTFGDTGSHTGASEFKLMLNKTIQQKSSESKKTVSDKKEIDDF